MKRRQFITLLGGVDGGVAAYRAHAQSKVVRLGYLEPGTPTDPVAEPVPPISARAARPWLCRNVIE